MAKSDLVVLDLKPPSSTINNKLLQHNEIPHIKQQDLSYNDFYWQYMECNYPVVLTDVSTKWECRRNWIINPLNLKKSNDNEFSDKTTTASNINFEYLKEKIGNCQVPVANCKREYFNSHEKSEMLFYDFLLYWQQKRGDFLKDDKTSTELSNIQDNNKTITTDDLLYLKDWHLKAQNAEYEFYKVPKHFASDWLNEYLVAKNSDDYRFVYMGPKDTWTPFHSDVFGSFSWSTNIMGTKKWLLLPPGEELKLADGLQNLPFCINESLLKTKNVKYFTLMQNENESLFVPSGWYHQVWNITDTISVNHNWFNACNLLRIWHNLKQQMAKVIKEIDDCRQMDNFMEHCQTMLRASFGLNYLDFLQLLECIVNRRLKKFNNNTASNLASTITSSPSLPPTSTPLMSSPLIFFEQFTPNDYHVEHDLQRIYEVLELMLQDSTVCDDRCNLYRKCIHLKELLTTSLALNLKT